MSHPSRRVGVQSMVHVTQEQAAAIIAMAPGDAVFLADGAAQYLGDVDDRAPLIAFTSSGVRPSLDRAGATAV